MSQSEPTEVSRLLVAVRAGDAQAGEKLLPLLYDELRRAATRRLASERAGHTFHPTDLVHDAWLRLCLVAEGARSRMPATDQAHSLGLTVRAMRQVLTDHARRRIAAMRGAAAVRVTSGDADAVPRTSPEEMLALFDAFYKLGAVEMRLRQVVECRYLAGLTEDETAAQLSVTTRTVQRDWVKARAWLHRQLSANETVSPPSDTLPGLSESLAVALGHSYDLVREIGRGGMSMVFLAHERKHDRDVVIKVLDPSIAHLFGAERFHREVRIAATLAHPNIVPLIDSGDADGFLSSAFSQLPTPTHSSPLGR